jgi:hypothetical protein
MAFVHGYTYDIFVSYAHPDNEPEAGVAWVQLFYESLRIALRQRLGNDIEIFFDTSTLESNDRLQAILDEARKSAVFLAVASPSYKNHKWTRDELRSFDESSDDPSRLFAIEKLPLDSDEQYPEPLNGTVRLNFWHRPPPHNTPLTLMPHIETSKEHYIALLGKLADQMVRKLKSMRREPAPEPKGIKPGRAAGSKAGGNGGKEPSVRPVLVAQVTEDLEVDREQLISYLTQYDVPVLPAEMYPQGGADFADAVTADLRNCGLFVQLLGPSQGRRPRDLPDGYVVAQSKLAGEAGLPILQWRPPNLEPDSIADEGHRAYLWGANVVAMGFESFKKEVVRRATAPPPPPAPADGAPPNEIFINANAEDLPVAETVYEKVIQHRAPAVLAAPEGAAEQVRLDYEQNWRDCGSVVLIYGHADRFWVRGQIAVYKKLKHERIAPPRKFRIINFPPKKSPLGIFLPEAVEVDFSAGYTPEELDAVVSDLLA